MVVAGKTGGGLGNAVIKYNTNGSVAWQISNYFSGSCYEGFDGIAVQPNRKIVVIGTRNNKITAIRINPDGTSDDFFSNTTVTPQGEAISIAI